MEAFFVRVLVAALKNPDVQTFISASFATAVADVRVEIQQDMANLRDALVAKLEALPGILLGDAAKPVETLLHDITGTKDDIAGAVKGEVQPLLPTVDSIQSMLSQAFKNLPGGGILGSIFG